MENGHGLRNFLLVLVGLVIAGVVAWWVIKALLGVFFYVLVGAAIVGGGMYLYGKAKRSLAGGDSRRIGQ
jgi:hypothetical protein